VFGTQGTILLSSDAGAAEACVSPYVVKEHVPPWRGRQGRLEFGERGRNRRGS